MSLPTQTGWLAATVRQFVVSKLSILFILVAFACGAIALLATPREEEPQIVVPMADILIQAPGATVAEMERLVTIPLEKKLRRIQDVEHIYSATQPEMAMVTIRYKVDTDLEKALIRLYNELDSNRDAVPPIVTGWIVKPVSIDDVPIVVFNLVSERYTADQLRLIAQEAALRLNAVPHATKVEVTGGRTEEVRVTIDIAKLSSMQMGLGDLIDWIAGSGVYIRAGSMDYRGNNAVVEVGNRYEAIDELASVAIPNQRGDLFRLGDIATVERSFSPRTQYVHHVEAGDVREMATISAAKVKGANAVTVAQELLATMERLRGEVIPDGVEVIVSRNYGETADEKVNELVKHLLIAIATIVGLLAFTLGWRESLIVAMAVPITLALTLILDYMLGFTINRVTLFALILSLGLLVDDPIVGVENISRHLGLYPQQQKTVTIVGAITEIFNPTLVATIAVVVSFIPLYFVTGMMGPYMRPMPVNIPIAMFWSLVVAVTITPWACARLLKTPSATVTSGQSATTAGHHAPGWMERKYVATLDFFLASSGRRWGLIVGSLIAFAASVLLIPTGKVPFKMLPFDNKNELLIVIDAPESFTLERTWNATNAIATALTQREYVRSAQIYAGVNSPIDFNGLVRKYYMRSASNMAEIRLNLTPKQERIASHTIALDIRREVERLSSHYGVRSKIVEMPPGPPVMASVVAEVYGSPTATYADIAAVGQIVENAFAAVPGVADIDNYSTEMQPQIVLEIDRLRAAEAGITSATVAQITDSFIHRGLPVGVIHVDHKLESLPIVLRLGDPDQSSLEKALGIQVKPGVPLGSIVRVIQSEVTPPIHRKDMRQVYFVTAESVGISPVDAVLAINRELEGKIPAGYEVNWLGEGETKITVDAFRDMGLAFLGAVVGIYVLLVAQTGVLLLPAIMIIAIPFTLVGILPGFWLLNILFGQQIGDIHMPVFFTATAFIGIIALAGIVVRNGIILIDFMEKYRTEEGGDIDNAIRHAAQVRMRPILLTALAAMFGAWVIVLDPIFSGLAWAFIFGITASTAFSLLLIPIAYRMTYGGAR
ncbi:efflux RND transporter permease subunit [Chrysiogenes arsenatis]|uniref:efflux RND transporter permease subunit n=1 Tax=Chrysiogenes arsenatis TaxID=309797 RepID=UPI00040A4F2A|nr:efflux RND transporter permease subunit [Chrysiogenes arsenatis]